MSNAPFGLFRNGQQILGHFSATAGDGACFIGLERHLVVTFASAAPQSISHDDQDGLLSNN